MDVLGSRLGKRPECEGLRLLIISQAIESPGRLGMTWSDVHFRVMAPVTLCRKAWSEIEDKQWCPFRILEDFLSLLKDMQETSFLVFILSQKEIRL